MGDNDSVLPTERNSAALLLTDISVSLVLWFLKSIFGLLVRLARQTSTI